MTPFKGRCASHKSLPSWKACRPNFYGGSERVVHWLTEELVAQGHDVTLFASGDSQTSASLVPVIPRTLRLGRPRQDPTASNAALLAHLAERAGEFDVIHCHGDWLHLPILRQHKTPYLTTLHGRIDLPGLENLLQHFPDAPFVSISDNQRLSLATHDTARCHWVGREINQLGGNSLSAPMPSQ